MTNLTHSLPLWAVIPAAGFGLRMAAELPKQYLTLAGVPLLQRTIHTLQSLPNVEGIVVALAKDDTLWHTLPASTHPLIHTVEGGANRADSVRAGVRYVYQQNQTNCLVLVHDAARALTSLSDITRLIDHVAEAPEHGGILATPVQDTLKRASESSGGETLTPMVKAAATVPRSGLWQAQTPQLFQSQRLLAALDSALDTIPVEDITDEAFVMERMGYQPQLVESLQPNFKLTRPTDLALAEAYLSLQEGKSFQHKD